MKSTLPGFKTISLSTITTLVFFVASNAFGQAMAITTPVTNNTFNLPDPDSFKNANDAQSAIAGAESAGKALAADAEVIKKDITPAQSDFSKAEILKSNYSAAVTAFDKNDVEPYKLDLDKYNAAGRKYTDRRDTYNKAAQANNALPASQRKAATVALLNKQRLQVDSMGKQLTAWETRLDATKTKLDVKTAALAKQKLQYEAAEKGPVSRLRAAKANLKDIQTQLTNCAGYAQKCHALLSSKFGAPASSYSGYFVTPEYQGVVSGINLQLVSLQFF